MRSPESSEADEKSAKQSRKSSCWWYRCFSQASLSESELDSDSEYVVMNHSVFKVPRSLQTSNDVNLNRSPVGSSKEPRTILVHRGTEKSGGYSRSTKKKHNTDRKKVTISEKKVDSQSAKSDVDEKIYQYIRMKTYERMNPYEMSPNDFLNNISSVFVDNLKDPVPKDPLNRPRVYNRRGRRRAKTATQLMYEKTKEKEKEKRAPDPKTNIKSSDVQSLRKPTINPAVMSDSNKNYGEEALGYKAAIEQEEKGKEYEEKVLIWKIVVANEEDEAKE